MRCPFKLISGGALKRLGYGSSIGLSDLDFTQCKKNKSKMYLTECGSVFTFNAEPAPLEKGYKGNAKLLFHSKVSHSRGSVVGSCMKGLTALIAGGMFWHVKVREEVRCDEATCEVAECTARQAALAAKRMKNLEKRERRQRRRVQACEGSSDPVAREPARGESGAWRSTALHHHLHCRTA